MKMKQLVVLTILISTLSCSNINNEKINYIIFGIFCGECEGNCATMYKLDDNYLLKDTTDNYFYNQGKLDNGFFVGDTMSEVDFEKAKIVKDKLPLILVVSNQRAFGNPDDRDQCGIYIQVKKGNQFKIFTIDTDLDKIPFELKEYSQLITNVILDFEKNE